MKQPKNSQKQKKTGNLQLTATSRLLIGSIPYVLFLIGIIMISISFFQYVVNQSALALFLTDRGRVASANWNGSDWSETETTPTHNPTQTPPLETNNPQITPQSTPEPAPTESEHLIVPFFYISDKIGTLNIPSVDIKVDVLQGDREAELRLGAGHYPGSYLPGQNNNILIAAHRTTHFRNLEYLEVGDNIYFETTYGMYVYNIDEIRIIDGNDNSVAGETAKEQLTLYTCYPFVYFGNAPNRFVVIASLVEE